MRLGYIVHNLNDPAVERRCKMLERGGASVTLAGFCRDAEIDSAVALRKPLALGRSHDAAMVQRAVATLRTALAGASLKNAMQGCDAIMARNLEQLIIARALVDDRPLIYECLDIHRTLTGSNMPSKAIQAIEGWLLKRVNLLLTSSPAFVRHHFAETTLRAPVELIENELLVLDDEPPVPAAAPPQPPITIGWFGMLRCRMTFRFLRELVEASAGRIEVLIAGKSSPAELPDLAAEVAKVEGMNFVGPYTYADLPELYGRCHFAWTIDWFEEGLNSSWLLPNRLYEALAHGAIPIALTDVEVGRWLGAHEVGFLVTQPEIARQRLLAMDPAEIGAMQSAVAQIDRDELIAGEADCRALVDCIAAARAV